MKKRTVVLYIAAVTLAVAAWLCLMPGSKKIDKTVQATEYSFADPDYTVEHNGPDSAYLDTRNCRFLVSGEWARDEAIALALDLTKGTTLEPVFANR